MVSGAVDPMAGPGVRIPWEDLPHALPWIFPPRGTTPVVSVSDPTTIPAGSTVVLLTAMVVPIGSEGVIQRFGVAADSFTDLRITLRVSRAPVQPIMRISYPYGTIALPMPIPGEGVRVGPGQTADVVAENVGVTDITGVRVRTDGYYWTFQGSAGG